MAACARAVQQQDGSLVLVLDPVASDLSTCAYVVQSGPEVADSWLSMTASDGAFYSASIVSVWVVAWCARSLFRVFSNQGEKDE